MNRDEFDALAAAAALHALDPDDRRAFERAAAEHPEGGAYDVVTDALADAMPEVPVSPDLRARILGAVSGVPQDGARAHRVDDGAAPDVERVPADGAPDAGAASADSQPDVTAESAGPAPDAERASAGGVPNGGPVSAGRAPATESAGGDPDATPAPRRGFRRFFALAASLALVLAVGGIALAVNLGNPSSQSVIAEVLDQPDARETSADVATAGSMTVHWSESAGRAAVEFTGLPTLPDNQTYQLWVVHDGTPVAAGFASDRPGMLDGSIVPGDVVAVTVEKAGGSATGQPTSDPIVAVTLTA